MKYIKADDALNYLVDVKGYSEDDFPNDWTIYDYKTAMSTDDWRECLEYSGKQDLR